uniref:HEPN domain-containing protein n=1 Tax=Ignisphaera aggregans TaxID=334771 RepID=A0A7J3QGP7_9CREN
MPVRDEALNWFAEANAGLRHAEASIEIGDYNWAYFAAQQVVEKALKALITHIVGEHLRSHDLVKLYRKVREFVEVKLSESL